MLRIKGSGLFTTPVLTDDVAIDLGTANTLVHVAGKGIVIDEPSVVAVSTRGTTREIIAIGAKAKAMLGRTPENIETIRPLRDGVIADFIAAEEMLRHFIRQTKRQLGFGRPRILISVPAGATPVERRAVYETAISAGARKAFLVEEPVAAAIGAGLPIDDAMASMVVDIGGGTTDVAVMSLGGVVLARSVRCAGNAMDEAIVRHIRRKHDLVIGDASAERIKVEAGTSPVQMNGHAPEIIIRGRSVRESRQIAVTLSPHDVAEALFGPVEQIADFIQRSLEDLPPEVADDVCSRGIYLTGGGALLAGLDKELQRRVGVVFHVPSIPQACVVSGSARILNKVSAHEHLLIRP